MFGELNPHDQHNRIIYDLELAPRNAGGNVEYIATFLLVKPIDMSKEQPPDVARRPEPRRPDRLVPAERTNGDIGLSSGWQGDNSGERPMSLTPGNVNDWVVVPAASEPGTVPRSPAW